MYIINESYFQKELVIPTSSNIDVACTETSFETYIDKDARLLLQRLLGSVGFTALDSLIVNGVYQADGSLWDDLVNGTTYTKNDNTYTWKGLAYEEGSFKGSVLAYYVYCKWLEFQLSKQTGMGEAKGNAINSMGINATHRYVTTWNNFIEMYQGTGVEQRGLTIINGIPFYDYFGGSEDDQFVSLVTYIKDNISDYEAINVYPTLKLYEAKNTLGV